MHRSIIVILMALTASALAGCAATQASSVEAESDPRSALILRRDGSTAAWRDLVKESAESDVVLIGENHGHARGLSVAAALWDDILASRPTAVLAMEFFERDHQAALDDYLAGLTDETAFRAASVRTESNYPPGHRAMVESARSAGRPVVAANAPRRYVRLARLEGYDRLHTLTSEQRRLFRVPDVMLAGEYRDRFDRVMTPAGQEPDARRLDAVFRSQFLWDWTMADSVANAIADRGNPVVLVVGRFHIDHDGGTVLALRRLVPGVRIVTVSFDDSTMVPAASDMHGRADFVVGVGPNGPSREN